MSTGHPPRIHRASTDASRLRDILRVSRAIRRSFATARGPQGDAHENVRQAVGGRLRSARHGERFRARPSAVDPNAAAGSGDADTPDHAGAARDARHTRHAGDADAPVSTACAILANATSSMLRLIMRRSARSRLTSSAALEETPAPSGIEESM